MRRNALLALLVMGSLAFQGCTLSVVTIAIPDFGSKAIKGVWLWRSTSFNGVYEREVQFTFGGTAPTGSGEAVDYTMVPADGAPPIPVTTHLQRDPSNPDRVTVSLIFSRDEDVAFYRASTYNTSGDSPLTSEIVPL
ncbi:hypothetical protein MYXO_03020 [Myxococcaceae bacterium]|nr:hypothetical protein MYXO_03020 [Myxococcaceae bacterium]